MCCIAEVPAAVGRQDFSRDRTGSRQHTGHRGFQPARLGPPTPTPTPFETPLDRADPASQAPARRIGTESACQTRHPVPWHGRMSTDHGTPPTRPRGATPRVSANHRSSSCGRSLPGSARHLALCYHYAPCNHLASITKLPTLPLRSRHLSTSCRRAEQSVFTRQSPTPMVSCSPLPWSPVTALFCVRPTLI